MSIASAIILGLLSLALTFRVFFKTIDDFLEALRHAFTRDTTAAFNGEWTEYQWNKLKLLFWFGAGGIGAFAGYKLFEG